MAKKSMALSVEIGGAVSQSFKSAFKTGTVQINKIGKAIGGMEKSAGRLTKFYTLKRSVEAAEKTWKKNQIEVGKLAKQIQATAKPTKKLRQEFDRAKKSAAKAKQSFESQRLSLHGLRSDMQAAGVSTRNLSGQQKKLGASIDKLKGKYRALATIRKKSEANMARRSELQGKLFGAVALGAMAAAPLKAAVDFESAMSDVRKVVDFPEPDGLKKMGASIRQMSREIPLAASELAAITAAGGQMGIATPNLAEFTRTVAKMATAFDMLPQEAGEAMGKLSNIFGLKGSELSSLGDAINHISNNIAAKAPEIIRTLNRIGGTTKDFGLSEAQASALSGAFIALGKPPEKAATAINAMLMKMRTATKQSNKFQDALGAIGMSASELESAISDDAQGALMGFLKTLSTIEKDERSGVLFDLFGMEYVDDISLLSGSLGTYEKALGLVGNKQKFAGSMQQEFQIRASTTANQLQLLRNSITEVGINIGTVLLPPLQAVVKTVMFFTTALATMAEKFPVLTKWIAGTTIALIALKVASIGVGYGWTFIKGGWLVFAKLTKVITLAKWAQLSFNASMAANPIGLIVAGVAALISIGILLYRTWEPFRKLIDAIVGGVIGLVKAVGKGWTKLFGGEPPDFSTARPAPGRVLSAAGSAGTVSSIPPPAGARSMNIANTVGDVIVNAAPGMDEEALAEKMIDKLARKTAVDRRGALYDLPDAYSY